MYVHKYNTVSAYRSLDVYMSIHIPRSMQINICRKLGRHMGSSREGFAREGFVDGGRASPS